MGHCMASPNGGSCKSKEQVQLCAWDNFVEKMVFKGTPERLATDVPPGWGSGMTSTDFHMPRESHHATSHSSPGLLSSSHVACRPGPDGTMEVSADVCVHR
jgi:hypothetical protein